MLTKAIAVCAALALSLAGNVWLLAGKAGERERAKAACDLRIAESNVAVLDQRAGVLDWIVQQTVRDDEETLARLDAVAARAEARNTRWRERDLPTPKCGPGQARVDATNEMLGHTP